MLSCLTTIVAPVGLFLGAAHRSTFSIFPFPRRDRRSVERMPVSSGETGGHFRGERGPVRARMNRGEVGASGQTAAETGGSAVLG